MKYLIVDASLNGTGIRDYYEGGYLNLTTLGLSTNLIHRIQEWLKEYEDEHYNGFENPLLIAKLDNEGKEIASQVKKELPYAKLEYFSHARMTREMIS